MENYVAFEQETKQKVCMKDRIASVLENAKEWRLSSDRAFGTCIC